ncbi:hypothetical protein ACH5RR_022098 [Cinchona calisaya]|uniref:Reverse transcriptase zinc-binding domain n=1 Tax=Cinchona calisaya TaxID=153742 RepID=A0ABD2Z6U3_9GENT
MCLRCRDTPETIEHLFFFCEFAKEVWDHAPISWIDLGGANNSYWYWWQQIREACEQRQNDDYATLSANILWQIWKCRNKENFEAIRIGIDIKRAADEWTEFEGFRQQSSTSRNMQLTSHLNSDNNEILRDQRFIVINTNSEQSTTVNKSGSSIVAKDRVGNLLAVWAASHTGNRETSLLEAENIHKALVKAKVEGWDYISIVCSNRIIVDKLNCKATDDVLLATLLEDI